MPAIKVHLIFPEKLVTTPVIYNLSKEHNVVTNIRRANVDEKQGWVDLELEGDEDDLKNGIKYLESLGIDVNLVEGDIVE